VHVRWFDPSNEVVINHNDYEPIGSLQYKVTEAELESEQKRQNVTSDERGLSFLARYVFPR